MTFEKESKFSNIPDVCFLVGDVDDAEWAWVGRAVPWILAVATGIGCPPVGYGNG